MNFFQSVFSDDPESSPEPSPEPQPLPQTPTPTIPSITSAWTFGSTLIKTLASKSESVIDTYRRDLDEFTSGIKRETAVIREAAVKAVKDLPNSLEAGAGLAQNSLESVGQVVEDLGSTVAEIITHSKESIDFYDSDSDVINRNNDSDDLRLLKPYSRIDAQIRSVESDMNTYLNDPEDAVEFDEWKLGFEIGEKSGEIEDAMREKDGVVGEIYREIVPARVDERLFWERLFYKVWKIRMAEEARVRLVKRAISGEEDEELSWDVDEDEYEENDESDLKVEENESLKSAVEGGKSLEKEDEIEEQEESEGDKLEEKSDMKTASEGRTDKDSDFSVVSSQPSPEEDGWDEIEDIGGSDENKDKAVSHGSHGSADRAELHKRLSVAAEEEDLTWDIEDDDETVKA